MADFTPGPWTISEDDEIDALWIDAKDELGLARIMPSGDLIVKGRERLTDEDKANARLIAAAPDLLDTLKMVAARWDSEEDMEPTSVEMRRLSVAIAKAEGRS